MEWKTDRYFICPLSSHNFFFDFDQDYTYVKFSHCSKTLYKICSNIVRRPHRKKPKSTFGPEWWSGIHHDFADLRLLDSCISIMHFKSLGIYFINFSIDDYDSRLQSFLSLYLFYISVIIWQWDAKIFDYKIHILMFLLTCDILFPSYSLHFNFVLLLICVSASIFWSQMI